ncbi:MAG: hypothetical protein V3V08_24200 [Nannocystaceae bacterium]
MNLASFHAVDLAELSAESRTLVEVRGADARRFLQGMLSADMEGIGADEARPAALLTVKGKLLCDAVVMRVDGDGMGLLLPSTQADRVLAELDRHIIMDDVQLELGTHRSFAVLWGGGDARPAADGVRIYDARHPAPRWIACGPSAAVRGLVDRCAVADAETWTSHRIDTASPAWGYEMTADRFPTEIGLVHAISYDKGCYRGQEPLARIHARGQVNRVLVKLSASGRPDDGLPLPLHAEGRENAGSWTSVTGASAKTRGLAVVHRSVAIPGTVLRCGDVSIRVASGPLGDDPGLAKKTKSNTVPLGRR